VCLGGVRAADAEVGPARSTEHIVVGATRWLQADALFHRDPRWLGSDGAYSVLLSGGRILWLFGDTVVAPTAPFVKTHGYFVRNTVAVERGRNPARASISFSWQSRRGTPASYFAEDGTRWYWPADGIQIGRALVVFLHRVRVNPRGSPGWNFTGDGWRLAVVADDSSSPMRWRPHLVAPPRALAGLDMGAALARVGGYVISLAVSTNASGGTAPGYLVRWRAVDLAAGQLDRAQWWVGRRGWLPVTEHDGRPTVVLRSADDGSSLTYDRSLGRWVFVRSEGFGATTIVVSFARRLEGPWSAQQFAFRPPESDQPRPNVYGAKGHAELLGAQLVVTYSTGTYPHFVRLRFSRR
jgi:hypothetical protein